MVQRPGEGFSSCFKRDSVVCFWYKNAHSFQIKKNAVFHCCCYIVHGNLIWGQVRLCNSALILQIDRHLDCREESQIAQVTWLLIANIVALNTLTFDCPLQRSNDHIAIMALTRGCCWITQNSGICDSRMERCRRNGDPSSFHDKPNQWKEQLCQNSCLHYIYITKIVIFS